MAIKIEMLRVFSAVAQAGNLADATSRLGRTQSAISMTLKQLEQHLGQKLFEGERKNRLTPLGAQVFELAKQQLRQFDETLRAIETSANAPAGLIRIASVPSVGGLVFPSVIETMTRRYPGLRVELRDTDTEQVIDALIHGQADIGVASGRHALNGVRQVPLFQDRFGLICRPDHPLARQTQLPTIAEVVNYGVIRNNLCSRIETPAFQTAIADAPVNVHNTLSLLAMVRTSNWVTVLPQTVVQIMPTELIFRPISDLPDLREVFLLLQERSPYLALAVEFQEEVSKFDWTRATD